MHSGFFSQLTPYARDRSCDPSEPPPISDDACRYLFSLKSAVQLFDFFLFFPRQPFRPLSGFHSRKLFRPALARFAVAFISRDRGHRSILQGDLCRPTTYRRQAGFFLPKKRPL